MRSNECVCVCSGEGLGWCVRQGVQDFDWLLRSRSVTRVHCAVLCSIITTATACLPVVCLSVPC
jgi:hypothetical protein